ncbi:type VI secretion system tube protein TssD [Spirosoma gilvum]
MSFKATLTVEGKEFNVLQCTHLMDQKYKKGRATSGVLGGRIIVILDSSDDPLLGSWATGPTVKKDGEIVFDRVDQQSSLQKLEFQEAYLTQYFEFMTSSHVSTDSVLTAIEDYFILDISTESEDERRVIVNRRALVKFAERTRISNCILLRISASKITLDGIDHENS